MRDPRLRWISITIVIVAVVALIISSIGGDDDGPQGELEVVELTAVDAAVVISAEVADERDERIRGLAGRESLEPDRGMLFVNDADVEAAFTMMDTLIPLSIAFLSADGTVLEILDMQPCEQDPCPTYTPVSAYRQALEVNLGAFGMWGIEPGDRIEPVMAQGTG